MQAGSTDGDKRSPLAVRFRRSFPHDGVEFAIILKTEDESRVVVVLVRIDKERPVEVDAAEKVISDGERRIAVGRLNDFGTASLNAPARRHFRFRRQIDALEHGEVRAIDFLIERTHVDVVVEAVSVGIGLTYVPNSVH